MDAAARARQVDDAPIGDLMAQDDVLGNRQRRNQHEVLVDHADAKPDGVEGTADLDTLAVEGDLARVWPQQAIDDVHQGGLAGAVLAQ